MLNIRTHLFGENDSKVEYLTFEYLFDEIKRIKAKHKHVKDIQRNGKISAQHNKICASPAGIKESQAMNYK